LALVVGCADGATPKKGVTTRVVGGSVTSALLEPLVYPVIFLIWKRRALNESS